MSEMVNIVGVLVHCQPPDTNSVIEQLNALPGTEVHAADDKGHIVVTVDESECEGTAIEQLEKMHQMDGVLCAALTYHHVEAKDRLDAPMPTSETDSIRLS